MTTPFPSLLIPIEPLPPPTPFLLDLPPILRTHGPLRVLYNLSPGHFGFSDDFKTVFEARTGRPLMAGIDGKWLHARSDSRVVDLVREMGSKWSSGANAVLEICTMDPMFQTTWSLCESYVCLSGQVVERIDPGVDKLLSKALLRHLTKPDETVLRAEVSAVLEADRGRCMTSLHI